MLGKKKSERRSRGIYAVTPGYVSWRWLSGIAAKQGQWLLGSLAGRGGFEAWAVKLVDGLQDAKFLAELETTTDPWQKSKIVGGKISELAKEYADLSREEKDELARRAEVELKAGVEMLSREKKRILELLKVVTAPLDDR